MDMYQILYLKVDICHQRCQSDFLNILVQKVDDGVIFYILYRGG